MFAQEASKEEAKEAPAQAKAEKPAKQARCEGIVVRSNKDESTLTVRKMGSVNQTTVHYDSSTQWTHQEHGSKNVVNIDPSQVKDNDRVICLGTYDQKGTFHATLISKRAPK
ncbi:MAG: hypothetical protein DMG98_28105 [Acidobacteria bacterium]|nr:MAG: hypothetical protein DMG98_28105 [Acidobacteriota bacterium]